MPARPPISPNGHRPGENGRPALEKLAICESVYPFFIPGVAYGFTVPPISTNAHQVGKSLRLAKKFFARLPDAQWYPPQRAELSPQIS